MNILEFDLINSFHLHGNLFHYIPTGTSKSPSEFTDTVMLCQGQRGILEMRFPNAGKYMFHAHQSEFTELGWLGLLRGLGASHGSRRRHRWRRGAAPRGLPAWVLGLVPLLLIIAAVGAFAALGGPGLGERRGPPAEELAVERTKLVPGAIELTVRNDGPDAVTVAQVFVNDAYVDFAGRRRADRAPGLRDAARSPTRGTRARPTRSRC